MLFAALADYIPARYGEHGTDPDALAEQGTEVALDRGDFRGCGRQRQPMPGRVENQLIPVNLDIDGIARAMREDIDGINAVLPDNQVIDNSRSCWDVVINPKDRGP